MKTRLKNQLKVALLFLMIVISFQNCENDEIPITIEMKGNSKVEKISFEDFKSNLNNLITLNKFNGLLDISKQKNEEIELPYISTREIIMAQTDSTTHYTFKVIAEKAGNEFYNLVFEVTTTGEINEFVILKYQPNISWLEDTATPFNGLVSIENDMFSPEDIDINALRPITNCATGASTSWLCSNNNPHGPSVGPPACYASSFSFIITIEWGACGTGTGNGSPIPVPQYTPNDNTYTGNGGTTGGFNSNSPVNTRPLSSPQEDIILCLSIDDLTGNSLLSQATKDCLLTSAIPRAKINALNNYLSDNACSTEAQSFGSLAAQAICDGGEVDYEEQVIIDIPFDLAEEENLTTDFLTDVCAKNIIEDEIFGVNAPGVNSNFINEIRNIFDSDGNVTLDFRNSNNVPDNADAATSFPEDIAIASGIYSISIGFSNDYLNENPNPTKLSIAMVTLHEMAHAKIIYSYLHGNLTTDYPLADYPNFSGLNTAIADFLGNRSEQNRIALNDAMHIAMVDLIGTMSYSLYKYAQKANMDNITHQYCKDITKGAFYNTPGMSLINTGNNTAEELNNKTVHEQNNTSSAQGDDC